MRNENSDFYKKTHPCSLAGCVFNYELLIVNC